MGSQYPSCFDAIFAIVQSGILYQWSVCRSIQSACFFINTSSADMVYLCLVLIYPDDSLMNIKTHLNRDQTERALSVLICAQQHRAGSSSRAEILPA